MKRSEMLEYIAERLENFDMGGKDSRLTYQESAEALLQELEHKGMQPPQNGVEVIYTGEDEIVIPEYGWEEE